MISTIKQFSSVFTKFRGKLNHEIIFDNISICNTSCKTKKLLYSQHFYFRKNSDTIKRKMTTFRVSDYDCIGFDLDHTLLWYNITNMVGMEYEIMVKYLTEYKGYDQCYLKKPLTDVDIAFMQKGLILDFERGNIMRTSSDGIIRSVSHGTRMLTTEEIEGIYPNQRWEPIDIFTKDPLATWNGPWSTKMRAFLDYFDMPIALIFARMVDAIDFEKNGPIDKYEIWPDILEATYDMFERTQFGNNKGSYFHNLKTNPDKYFRKCSHRILNWLEGIKKQKITFLMTGSHIDFADFAAKHIIGDDWKSLFDIIICYARKPGFFIGSQPFFSLSEYKEEHVITGEELVRGGIYSQGNWNELKKFFTRVCNKESPACLYFGDNLIQDIYAPSVHCGWDTVVVSEELFAERMVNTSLPHPDTKYLVSNYWGSYFSVPDRESRIDSLWSHIIQTRSKICIPSLEYLSSYSLNHPYGAFDKDNKHSKGFYPSLSIPVIPAIKNKLELLNCKFRRHTRVNNSKKTFKEKRTQTKLKEDQAAVDNILLALENEKKISESSIQGSINK